ncbi:MAG: hypothetical protein JXO72_15060 [Vicinamibacteria bacterium]|nr:hypothetical protein [Vicinamibacteria bacterium]
MRHLLLGLCLVGLTVLLINAGLDLARQGNWTGVAVIGAILLAILGIWIVSAIQGRRRR